MHALLGNIILCLAPAPAVFALVAPSRLPARALALFATRAGTRLLAPPPALDALLDTTQASKGPGLAVPALLALNVLAPAALLPRFALLAIINLNLLKLPAPLAPLRRMLPAQVQANVHLALVPLVLGLPRALPVAGRS